MKLNNIISKEDAVSPVIGVMLMLVITIIIAGVVTAFTSGLVDANSVSPNAYFDVKIKINENAVNDDDYCIMTIEHLGGESIDTDELEILTHYSYNSFTNTGGVLKPVRVSATTSSVTTATQLTQSGSKTKTVVPYLSDVGVGVPGDVAVNFGVFTFSSGDVMTTGTTAGTARVLGFGGTSTSPSYSTLTNAIKKGNSNGFGSGSIVEVQILHKPTQSILFKDEVRAE